MSFSLYILLAGFVNKPVKCATQRDIFAQSKLPVEPKFTDTCEFEPKQCNNKKCWCVHPISGYVTSDGAVDQDYDCERKKR